MPDMQGVICVRIYFESSIFPFVISFIESFCPIIFCMHQDSAYAIWNNGTCSAAQPNNVRLLPTGGNAWILTFFKSLPNWQSG